MKKIYFKATNLSGINWIKHGFFTRNGGSSNGIYEYLNCGFGSNDTKSNIINNRKTVLNYLNLNSYKLFIPNQFHSAKVEIINKKSDHFISADGLITYDKGVAIGVLTADCAPLIFVDKKTKTIAVIHCGWKGTIDGIVENTIKKLLDLGSKISDLFVSIGPCISIQSYEVKSDFLKTFEKKERNIDQFFIFQNEKNIFFNLPKYIEYKLIECGIKNICLLNLDTYTNQDNFYSYRRSIHNNESDYGRQISLIAITN